MSPRGEDALIIPALEPAGPRRSRQERAVIVTDLLSGTICLSTREGPGPWKGFKAFEQESPVASFPELYEGHTGILARERGERGRRCVGTLCSYVPVELIHSFGIIPVRIWGRPDNADVSDTLLQPFICPPVRQLMALGMEGRYEFLDGIVHCYTCDATCGLYNIWVRNLKPGFSHMVSLPYVDIDEARAYAVAELEALVDALESLTRQGFSPESLGRSIALYNEARSLSREVYRLKAGGFRADYLDIHYMNLCAQVLPVETFLPRLEEFVEELPRRGRGSGGRARLLLSGSVINDDSLLAFIEQRGGEIVADDTCLGLRLLGDAIPDREPLESVASYYLGRTPCASRADFPSRKRYILETVGAFEVDAVIFVHQKFCDAHLSDHPFLKRVLDDAGIPSTRLELEGVGFDGQVRTRIESFFEMLEAR